MGFVGGWWFSEWGLKKTGARRKGGGFGGRLRSAEPLTAKKKKTAFGGRREI